MPLPGLPASLRASFGSRPTLSARYQPLEGDLETSGGLSVMRAFQAGASAARRGAARRARARRVRMSDPRRVGDMLRIVRVRGGGSTARGLPAITYPVRYMTPH